MKQDDKKIEKIWETICKEANVSLKKSNYMKKYFEKNILSHRGFADAVLAMLQPCRWRASEPSARPSTHQLVEPVQLVFFSDLRRERAAKADSFLQSLGSR